MNSKVGIFMLSGGKDSLLATELLYRDYPNRIGVLIDVPRCTIVDESYLAYMQRKFGMLIFRVKYLEGGLERFILSRKDDDTIVPRPNPVFGASTFMNQILKSLRIRDYDLIGGLNASDISTNPVGKAAAHIKRPLENMTDTDIWAEIKNRGLKVNPVYKKGFTKHSCYPCLCWANKHNISTLKQNVEALKKHYPKRYLYWCEWEKKNNIPFFKIKKGEYKWLHQI